MTIEELKSQISKKVESRNKLITETKAMANAEDADMTEINKRMSDIDSEKVEIDKLKKQLETRSKIEALKEEQNKTDKKEGEMRNMKIVSDNGKDQAIAEKRSALNNFVHSKGQVRDGLVSDDVGVTIPEELIYQPENEIKTTYNLKQYVNVVPVNSAKGSYPVRKKATARFNTVAELEANPALAKPEFNNVDYAVQTYRGSLSLSQESIDDSQIDVTGLVNNEITEQKLNTTNSKIAEVLKSFTAKEVSGVDDIKHVINVDLDPAYSKSIVCSQSFYQILDTLTDKNGQYLLHQDISSNSPTTFLGLNVVVVADDLLGAKAGDQVAFIGDLKRGVLFADRADVSINWAEDQIYGKYLMGAIRFDVKKADANAGFYVNFPGNEQTTTSTTVNP
ncbi:phage major capsid protein [Sporolactobacillus shoreicorticis]|uniref:Phage major capsid protein n=1 Tax=Sporolactobacillus shoreicorticis TaxID=1923877 RepID=A0ABW5S6F4_9BACL|nr:phage major capsid protein [Sporolactobacillus shoreicorticis]MCO7126633.1 phage major capsid protein [Sporolactobacillus shoreicorticis]